MTYGYARISTKKQSIERQIRNILSEYPDAIIVEEAYTGTKIHREKFDSLLDKVKEGDTIVFDSVSRMSRNADDGVKLYMELFDKGINLVFLKERYIDTEVYASNLKDKIQLTGEIEDKIFIGINDYFRALAEKQVRIAFEQAQKEVDDMRQRTKEGLVTAKLNGKKVGASKGDKYKVKKKDEMMIQIQKYSKDFDGNLTDIDVIKLTGLARNTYYKYKKELLEIKGV